MTGADPGAGGDPRRAAFRAAASPVAPACRSCGGAGLVPVLSLGSLPLANAYPPADDRRPEPRHALDLFWCGGCGLAQLGTSVEPAAMFSDYLYLSSYSDTMAAHARDLAARLVRERRLGPGSLVVEAASNDGYLLKEFVAAGVPVLGIEPAANVAAIARRAHGVETRVEYFGRECAARRRGEGRAADLFLGLNVLAHVPDVNGFVAGIRTLLKDEGVAVIEVPYLPDLVEKVEFDTIYHEHVFYYSLHALDALFRRHGLAIAAAERLAIHGGSIRVTVAPGATPPPAIARALTAEAEQGACGAAYYRDFADRVGACIASVQALLGRLRREGARVAAYGAAAKGTILLNACGIGADLVEFVADRNPLKQGRRMPGVGIPIVAPEEIAARRPDYVLLLAWNYAGEIIAQQDAWRRAGGRFILPVPVARVL